jgi:hypothetical protein
MSDPSPRAFDDQSLLEKWLRVDLYHAKAELQRAEEGLPKAVKAKEYRLAGSYQDSLYGLRSRVKHCLDLLKLYEAEFHGGLTEDDTDDF